MFATAPECEGSKQSRSKPSPLTAQAAVRTRDFQRSLRLLRASRKTDCHGQGKRRRNHNAAEDKREPGGKCIGLATHERGEPNVSVSRMRVAMPMPMPAPKTTASIRIASGLGVAPFKGCARPIRSFRLVFSRALAALLPSLSFFLCFRFHVIFRGHVISGTGWIHSSVVEIRVGAKPPIIVLHHQHDRHAVMNCSNQVVGLTDDYCAPH